MKLPEPDTEYNSGGVVGSIIMLVKFEHPLKHAFPINVTELGIVIDSRDVDRWNEKCPNCVMDSGKSTSVKEEQSKKNDCGILVIISL